MNYTKEQFETLKKYHKHLMTARYGDYIRISDRKSLEELDKVFKEAFHKESGILNGCMRCILRDIKALAIKYVEDDEILSKAEAETKTEETVTEAPKKTRRNGRKKSSGE